MKRLFFLFSLLASALTSTPLLAQQVSDSSSVFTTDKKPLIEKSGRKTVVDQIIDAKDALINKGKDLKKAVKGAIDDPQTAILSRASANVNGQDLNADQLPDLGLKIDPPKKKKKTTPANSFFRNDYEGTPVTHIINRFGSGDRTTMEEFFVLKEYSQPSPYAKDITWYDYRASRITNTPIKDKAYSQILHGPYRRYVGDNLMEEGFFYMGTKHGRWASYNTDFTLKDKGRYAYGFPEESYVSYYDEAQTKVKEIIPRLYGKCTGDYRSFYEGGQLMMEGKMDDSVKVGKWREYHQFGSGGRTKREIQYGRDKWEVIEPVVLREWDNKGKLVFENKDKRKPDEDDPF